MVPSGPRPYRRRRWIVNRGLQFRFVKAMLLVLLGMAAAGIATVYLTAWATASSFELSRDPVFMSLLNTIGWTIALELLLVAPVVAWFGIRLTHRIAGPLARLHEALSQMSRGDYGVHIVLRKGDELTGLADAINHLAATLKRRSLS